MSGPCLLAATVFATFTLSAQLQGGAAPSGATIAHARSAAIDGKRFPITPRGLRGVTSLERQRSVFLGVLGNEAGAAESVRLFPGRFDLRLIQVGGAWAAYVAFGGKVYPAIEAIEELDGPPGQQRTFRRGSGCWWLWLFTGLQVCWVAHA